MHSRFGFCPGHKCAECSNLVQHLYDTTYYKCMCYGESSSEATDWRKKYDACGLFNREYSGRRGMWFVKRAPRPKDDLPECEGQIEFGEIEVLP